MKFIFIVWICVLSRRGNMLVGLAGIFCCFLGREDVKADGTRAGSMRGSMGEIE